MTAEILLVDDNAIQAATRRIVLQKTGKAIAVAGSAEEALELLHDAALLKSVGLVITDHSMPGMNGSEFVARLRDFLPSIPVVVLSGYPDVEGEYEGLNVLFRMKPLAPESLMSIATSLLEPPLTKTA